MAPEQQTAFDNALRDGISRKDMNMIRLALEKGAEPNLLLFAAIDYKMGLSDRFHIAAGYRHNVALFFGNALRTLFEVDRKEPVRKKTVDDMRLEWMQAAIHAGADVNATRAWSDDNGVRGQRPAAHFLHDNFSQSLMDCLIDNGFKIDTPSTKNNTLLMRAVQDKKSQLVEYYLSKSADPMHPCGDNNESFPLQELERSNGFSRKTRAALLTAMMKHVKKQASPAPKPQPAPVVYIPPPAPVEPEHSVAAPEKAQFAKTEHRAPPEQKQQPKHGFAL